MLEKRKHPTVGAGVGKALGAAANSTKVVQSTMSKNITETAKTLNKMGASSQTTQKAMNKITEGMGNAGKNTANNIAKAEAAATMATEGAIKTAEAAYQNKKPNQ
jgi:polyribonucleotide nucleotidyltransferase